MLSIWTGSQVVLIRIKLLWILARNQWLTPVILAIHEAEIRRIVVQSQFGQIVLKTLSRKTLHKQGLMEWLKVKALGSSPSKTKKKVIVNTVLTTIILKKPLLCSLLPIWSAHKGIQVLHLLSNKGKPTIIKKELALTTLHPTLLNPNKKSVPIQFVTKYLHLR
jgi:hypothetical protein